MWPLPNLIGAAIWLAFPCLFSWGFATAECWTALAVMFPASVAWSWPTYNDLFRRCDQVTLAETGACEFRSGARWIRLDASQIVSIGRQTGSYNDRIYAIVSYEGGKLWVLQPMSGWEDFLGRLRQLNPAVVI